MKSKIDYYIINIKAFIISLLTLFARIDKKKIVIDNFMGKGFGDNGKFIAEEIHNQDPSIKIFWVVRNSNEIMPEYIKKIKYGTFKSLYHYATAKIWVDNVRNNIKPLKKNGQYYLQTWHGPFSPKLIEAMTVKNLSKEYVKLAKKDGKNSNGILSNSRLLDDQYLECFWLNDKVEILKYGFPRNDFIINHKSDIKKVEEIKRKLKINKDCFTVLYAPTFRDDYSLKGYEIDFEEVIRAFERLTKKKCTIMVRLHPNVQKYSKIIDYDESIVDVTLYPSVQELSIACDAIISDYSTTLFDFAIQGKPVFICALDLEEYKKMRGLVKEFYSYPFPYAFSNEELINNIQEFNVKKYREELEKYLNANPIYDKGDASIKVANLLIKKTKEK